MGCNISGAGVLACDSDFQSESTINIMAGGRGLKVPFTAENGCATFLGNPACYYCGYFNSTMVTPEPPSCGSPKR
jgi:hypothetical protein